LIPRPSSSDSFGKKGWLYQPFFFTRLVNFTNALVKKLVILIGLLALAATACRKNEQQRSETVKIVACDLVTKDEVAAIQGTTISGANESEGAIGALLATQCYYSSIEPNKSVTVGAIQPRPGQTGDPIAFWRNTFDKSGEEKDRPKDKDKDKDGDRDEEDEKRGPPTKITGIGDEAFWDASAIGGTFYVLKKDKHVFLRISVGGPDTTETKLEKSKKIAEDALRRL
jgi:hypothetical protein